MNTATAVKQELTLAIIKPDLFNRIQSKSTVLPKALASKGLQIVARNELSSWPKSQVQTFYKDHKGKFFYPRLVNYMSSGPVTALILKGPNAVSAWRELIGPTHLKNAKQTPTCLRAQFALSDTRNSFHGSDSRDSALTEIYHFFPSISIRTLLATPQQKKDPISKPSTSTESL